VSAEKSGRPEGRSSDTPSASGDIAPAIDDWAGEPSLIDFPASLDVKAMGLDEPDFEDLIRSLVEPHIAPPGPDMVTLRRSSGGKFVSVRVHFTATGKAQLEAIYAALRGEPRVLFTL